MREKEKSTNSQTLRPLKRLRVLHIDHMVHKRAEANASGREDASFGGKSSVREFATANKTALDVSNHRCAVRHTYLESGVTDRCK